MMALARELDMKSADGPLPEIRYRWVVTQEQSGSSESYSTLQHILRKDSDPGVRLRAALALAHGGHLEGFDYLLKALRAEDRLLAHLAGLALGRLCRLPAPVLGASEETLGSARKRFESWWNTRQEKQSEEEGGR